jgi:hypothetical protein
MEMGTNQGEINCGKHVHAKQISTNTLCILHNTTPNQSKLERYTTQGPANTAQLSNHDPAINKQYTSIRQATRSIQHVQPTPTQSHHCPRPCKVAMF